VSESDGRDLELGEAHDAPGILDDDEAMFEVTTDTMEVEEDGSLGQSRGCRHLVSDRMDLTGARWSLAGAEAVLRLRALRSSGDFEQYWRFHEQREYQRNHVSRCSNGHVVPVQGRHPRACRSDLLFQQSRTQRKSPARPTAATKGAVD